MRNAVFTMVLVVFITFPGFAAARVHEGCTNCHIPVITSSTAALWTSPSSQPRLPQADRSSRTCLACHDSTVGMSTAFGPIDSFDVRSNHPTSVAYRPHDETLRAVHEPSGLGSTIADDLLVDGRVECVSCHDPHGGSGAAMLRMSNDGSRLCLVCHRK